MRFQALQTFECPELGDSVYCEGMTYTVRPGDEKLATLLPDWEKDGKVTLTGPPQAAVQGG